MGRRDGRSRATVFVGTCRHCTHLARGLTCRPWRDGRGDREEQDELLELHLFVGVGGGLYAPRWDLPTRGWLMGARAVRVATQDKDARSRSNSKLTRARATSRLIMRKRGGRQGLGSAVRGFSEKRLNSTQICSDREMDLSTWKLNALGTIRAHADEMPTSRHAHSFFSHLDRAQAVSRCWIMPESLCASGFWGAAGGPPASSVWRARCAPRHGRPPARSLPLCPGAAHPACPFECCCRW